MDPIALLRTVYLLGYLSLGIFAPYLSLYVTRRGVPPELVPWVIAVVPAVRIFAPPLWGWLADATSGRALLLRRLALASLASALALPLAEGPTGFVLVLGLVSLTHGPIFSLLDAIALAATEARNVPYGTVRNLGSLGFLVGVLAGGWLWEGDGILLAHRGLAATLVLLALVVRLVPEPARAGPVAAATPAAPVSALLGEPALVAVLAIAFLHTTVHTGYDAYFSLHCEALRLSTRVTSAAWALGVLAEVLLLARSRSLLARLGPERLILTGIGLAAFRWTMNAWLVDPALLVPLQALHSFTFGAWFLGSITLVDRLSPPALRATTQGVFAAAIALANTTGSVLWGRLGAAAGTPRAFAVMGIAELAILVLAGVLLTRLRARPAPTDAAPAAPPPAPAPPGSPDP